jgi:platelet-activating factor acetylhydrolase IB subunit alpha
MVLTEKQRDELHKAILEYFKNLGFEASFNQFKLEAKVTDSDIPNANVLEKKWVSVLRLQKKIEELQAEMERITQEYEKMGKFKLNKKAGTGDNLLEVPAKRTFEGHRGNITKVAFHPIFCLVASASEDASIKIWDIEKGKLEHSLIGHTDTVNYICFNNAGTLLASCSSDLTIRLWKFDTYECIKTLTGHDHSITGLDFISTGDYLASASRDKSIKIWEISTGFCKKTINGHNEWVRRVIAHPTLPIIASCSHDQTIIVWEIEQILSLTRKAEDSGKIKSNILGGHENVIESIAFANDKAVVTIFHSDFYSKSPNSLGDKLLNKEEIKGNHNIKVPEQVINKIYLASGGRDKLIKIWEVKEGKEIATLVGHDNWVREVMFHPNGKFLISVSDDKTIRMWDLHSFRCIKKITEAHTHFVTSVSLSEKYMVAATGSVDNKIKIWDCN